MLCRSKLTGTILEVLYDWAVGICPVILTASSFLATPVFCGLEKGSTCSSSLNDHSCNMFDVLLLICSQQLPHLSHTLHKLFQWLGFLNLCSTYSALVLIRRGCLICCFFSKVFPRVSLVVEYVFGNNAFLTVSFRIPSLNFRVAISSSTSMGTV